MGRSACYYAQGMRGAVASAAAILCAALLALFVLAPGAWADEPAAPDGADQAPVLDAADPAETWPEDAAGAGDSEDDPIKPRPRVEITTAIVTLEPAEDGAISDEAVPLAAFDIEPCFIHLLMVCGIAVTIGYTFFAYRRTRVHTLYLDSKTAELTDGFVTSSEPAKAASAPAPLGAPASADR